MHYTRNSFLFNAAHIGRHIICTLVSLSAHAVAVVTLHRLSPVQNDGTLTSFDGYYVVLH